MSRIEDLSSTAQVHDSRLVGLSKEDRTILLSATDIKNAGVLTAQDQLGLPRFEVTTDGTILIAGHGGRHDVAPGSGKSGAPEARNGGAGGQVENSPAQTNPAKKLEHIEPPVPLGHEPMPTRTFWERLKDGPVSPIGGVHEMPQVYYSQGRNAGLITLPGDSPEDFARKYPKLVEYNRRVEQEVDESAEYEKLMDRYLQSLPPSERAQIAKEWEQYKKEEERLAKLYAHGEPISGRPHAQPGPHLKAYLEHVHELKQAAHEIAQGQMRAIGAELGPEFKKQQAQWEAERRHNLSSV